MATAYPGGLRKRGGLLDEFMAPDYSYLARRAELTPKQREYAANVPVDLARGSLAGLLGTPADVANIPQSPMPMEQFGEYSYAPAQKIPYGSEYFLENLPLAPARDNPLGRVAGQVGSFAPMVPVQAARMAGKGVMAAGRAGERLAERVVPQVMERGGLLGEMVAAMGQGTTSGMAAKRSPALDLTGALRPGKAPVRGETSKELVRQQKKLLSDDEKEILDTLKQKYPDFASASKFMTGQEVQKLIRSESAVKEVSQLLSILPNAKEMSSMAKAGQPKQGWYRASTQAIIDVFGADDAPRFASLLAALSPQTSVEMNLLNTLNTWKNWTAAGRPTDARAIKEIMGRSVSGTKGEESILGAWENNAFRSLSAPDPAKVTLSGPKVDSFYKNLADDVYKVTNDAWMANALGVNQNLFSGSPTALQLAKGDPGLTPGYIATNARLRQGAQQAGMFPSEGQETIWSLAMPLMEGQTSMGLPARAILDQGKLTPDIIRGTPDFSTLLNQGNYQDILRRAGYEEQLAALKPYEWSPSNVQLSMSEQRDIDSLAKRLEELQGFRQMESRGKVISLPRNPQNLPDRAIGAETYEMIPFLGSGHLEELINQPAGSRANFSSRAASAFQDVQGRDILSRSLLDENVLKTRGMQGAYRPPGGVPFVGPASETGLRAPTLAKNPIETNTGFANRFEVPVTYASPVSKVGPALNYPQIPRKTQEKLGAVAATRGLLTAQGGSPYNVQVPYAKGESMFFPLEKKVGEDEIRYAYNLAGDEIPLADYGTGVAGLNFGKRLPAADIRQLQSALGSKDYVPTYNISDYVDYSNAWRQPPGSGAATTQFLEYFNKLSAKDQAKLSQASMAPAGDLYDIYAKTAETKGYKTRADLMNLLDFVRNKGLLAIPAALSAGAAFPATTMPTPGGLLRDEDLYPRY